MLDNILFLLIEGREKTTLPNHEYPNERSNRNYIHVTSISKDINKDILWLIQKRGKLTKPINAIITHPPLMRLVGLPKSPCSQRFVFR